MYSLTLYCHWILHQASFFIPEEKAAVRNKIQTGKLLTTQVTYVSKQCKRIVFNQWDLFESVCYMQVIFANAVVVVCYISFEARLKHIVALTFTIASVDSPVRITFPATIISSQSMLRYTLSWADISNQ